MKKNWYKSLTQKKKSIKQIPAKNKVKTKTSSKQKDEINNSAFQGGGKGNRISSGL